ncbi:uncharacterized protein LOC117219620 [Megalopta genalis]|uniref:uncharacterized protein LOC117219620 n=1 Tax=Megalopta genalis TaxID=115081 RepID=UPI003FD099B9
MTSMDSGVEMGNDSNDSSITQHENLSVSQIGTVNSTVATTTTTTITTSLTTTSNCESGPNTFFIQARSFSMQSPISSFSAMQSSTDTENNRISVPISAPLQHSYGSFHEHLKLQSLPCAYSRSTNVIRYKPHYSGKIKSFVSSRDRPVCWPYYDRVNRTLGIKMRLAACTNNTEIMEKLLDNGISPNVLDDKGQTPLHIACSQGYPEMVQLLLQHGANPNHRDRAGNTPLHLASLTCCISVVSLLLKAGAKIVTRDGDGYNALQLAQEKLKLFPNFYSDSKVDDIQTVKKQVHDIINLLLTYLQQQKNSQEAVEALSTFYSRLSLSNASNQI